MSVILACPESGFWMRPPGGLTRMTTSPCHPDENQDPFPLPLLIYGRGYCRIHCLMIEQEYIKSRLANTKCYKCGSTLEGSTFALLNDRMPLITIGHVVCAKCQSQSMVTLTMAGNGVTPMMTDLTSEEIVKFAHLKEISYTELLDLHKALKDESLCKLMQKSEKKSAKKIKL